MRRFTPVELAVGVALGGSLLAVAVPSFLKNVHASRLAEPVEGLARLAELAAVYAETHQHFPENAPLTPTAPPRGTKVADPPGTWETPAWKAVGFRPTPEGVPHAFAFGFESGPPKVGTELVAQARGDLDGDGVLSLFEVRASVRAGDKPKVLPGMYIEAELE